MTVPSFTEAVEIVRKLGLYPAFSPEVMAEFGIGFMREALAATQAQRDPRSQSECYWDGWNDACDAVISTSCWKRLWAEMKRPRTDALPAAQEPRGEPGLTEDEHTTARHLKTCAVRRELPTWAEIEFAADALLARHTGSYVAVSSSKSHAPTEKQ